MKKIFVLLVFLLSSITIFAESLSSSSVTSQTLKNILDNSFLEYADIDDDGDLYIKKTGIKIYIEINDKRKMLEFRTGWKISQEISENRLNRLLNKWNFEKIFVKAYGDKEKNNVRLEYFLCYDGGVNSENFNQTLDWLFKLSNAFEDYLDEEDVF